MKPIPGEVLIKAGLELVEGRSPGDAAKILGVSRQTIWRWRNGDWAFLGKKGRTALLNVLRNKGIDVSELDVSRETTSRNERPEVWNAGLPRVPSTITHEIVQLLLNYNLMHLVAPHIADASKWVTATYAHASMKLPPQAWPELETIRSRLFGPHQFNQVGLHSAEDRRTSEALAHTADTLLQHKGPVPLKDDAAVRNPRRKAATKRSANKKRRA